MAGVNEAGADVLKLKTLMESYGIGVRAGLITPCLEDENHFRRALGLPDAPPSVVADWQYSGGVRRPVTLTRPSDSSETGESDEPKAVQQEATQDEL